MPVEVGDRRHVILEGADTHAGAESARTRRYFGPILRTDIRDIAALLFTLDLSTFRPRALPQTDAKQYQMVQSMSSTRPVQAFLHCCLQTGKFVFTEKETDRYGEPIETQCGMVTDGKLRMSKKYVYKAFRHFCRDRQHVPGRNVFWKQFRDVAEFVDMKPTICGRRVPSIEMKRLAEARSDWEAMVNTNWQWEDGENGEWNE